MNEIVYKTRKRFTLIGTILASGIIFLLVLFINVSNIIIENNTEQEILNSVNAPTPSIYGAANNKIMTITVSGNQAIITGFEEYNDKNEVNKIVSKSLEVKNGRFNIEDSYYVVAKSTDTRIDKYIVYDRTVSHYNTIIRLNISLIIFLLGSVASLFILWQMSKKAVQPVEESFKKQEELIANASHELKTPIAVIMSSMSVMESEPSSTIENNKQWISNIDTSLSKMNDLVLEMLELSKIENLKDKVELSNVDVASILNSEILAMDAICYEKNINIEYSDYKNIFVQGNEQLLSKTFEVLIDNALKYTPSNGTIYVNVIERKKNVEIKFKNTGSGIREDDLKHVFERFYKKDTRSRYSENKSFGLGLAIAQANIKSMKGDIKVTSDSKTYTEFAVTLLK